jgi:hypothetical protein
VALSSKRTTTKKGLGRERIELRVDDKDLRNLLRSFNRMDDIAKNDMRKIAGDISERVANQVKQNASAYGNPRQNQAVVQSLKLSKSEKSPYFSLGGSQRVTSRGTAAGNILAGAEFGSNRFRQFPPHRGQQGYFIFPTLRAMQKQITREWLDGYKLIRDAWIGRVG